MENLFDDLEKNTDFTSALGRMVLASAKFESSITRYIDAKGVVSVKPRSPLGILLETLVKKHTIAQTAVEQFYFLLNQRNYFVHKLHCNLSEYPTNELEIQKFINRANGIAEEMEFFSKILNEAATSKST